MSLVRAAWERRPEGPAYLLPSVTLLYLAGQCAFFCTHLPPWIRGTRRVFPEFLWIPDLSPLTVISSERERSYGPGGSILEKASSLAISNLAAAQVKNFYVFGCGWWYDRETCYSPHYVNTERDYERDYQATLPQGRTAADGCKPRHGRDDRKRERSFSGLREKTDKTLRNTNLFIDKAPAGSVGVGRVSYVRCVHSILRVLPFFVFFSIIPN